MTISESHEIERKYTAPPRTAVPKLGELKPVDRVRRRKPVELEAQYYDTADLDLVAHKITLRRRVGGVDEGWHLKLPAVGYRREIHFPLSDGDGVPEAFLTRLHPVLRGRDLAPSIQLTTTRTVHELLDPTGVVLAEVCDDKVRSTPGIDGLEPQEWREWEVELIDGEPELLDQVEPLLVERGASTEVGPSKLARALAHLVPDPRSAPDVPSDPTVGDVARAYLYREIERLKANDPGARLHEEDAIHQMRVAARRLRSVLSSYRDLVGREVSAELRGELKALADALGDARDSEVMLARLNALIDDQPGQWVQGPVRERINETLKARYDIAHDEAVEFMTRRRYFELLDALDALVDHGEFGADADKRGVKALVRYFDRDWKRLRAAVRLADELEGEPEQEEALHDVRKAAKRLRYGMDSIADVVRPEAKQIAKAASQITEILGDHQDSVITSQMIAELADGAHTRGEHTLTYGRMQVVEETNASVSQDEYRAALETLNDNRFARWKKL